MKTYLTPEKVRELLAEGAKLRAEFEKRIAPMKVPQPEPCPCRGTTCISKP